MKPRCHGNVLTELAIILPLVFFIGLAALDLSRAVNASKVAASLSREIANYAFFNCDVCTAADHADLTDQLDTVQDFAEALIPGARVLVSVYHPDGNDVQLAGTVAHPAPDTNPASWTTKFLNRTDARIAPLLLAAANRTEEHPIIVVGEAYVPFRFLIPAIGRFILPSGDHLYEATVY